MSHDNRVYLNTTLNNVVVIDSEQNQIAVTHPITQVIEITRSPTPTVTVVEETPNNVSVTEAIGNTVIVSATGPQGIQGIRGADPELTALEQFTGSIQTQVNSLRAATSSYVQNSQTASMLQPYVLTSITSSMIVSGALTSSYYQETDPIFVSKSGSFAITGSNIFKDSQTVSGSVYVSGSVDFNNGSKIVTNFYGVGGIDIVAELNGYAELSSNNTQSFIWVTNDGSYIGTSWDTKAFQWEFRDDGYFVIPQVQSLTKQAGILSAGDIIIQADEARSWRFSSGSGILSAPGAIEAISFTGSLSGSSTSATSASYAVTASYALNISEINTAAFVVTSSFNSYTGSVQTQINNINNATSSYVRNSQTSSMSVATASLALTASLAPNYVLTSSTSSMSVLSSSYAATASRLEGMFSLSANSSANNRTISSIGGLAFNNNASIDQDVARSIIFRTTPDGNVGSLVNRLIISGSGQVIVARPTGSYTLHTGGTFGLGTGGSSADAAAFTYDGVNTYTFRNIGGDNGLGIITNISTNNIQAIVRPIVATSNPGFALAPASASNANANHLVIGGLHPDQRPNIGIGTFTPFVSASLTVSGGVILGGTTSLISPWNDWSMQIQAGGAGKAIGLYSDIVGQYAYGTTSPSYLFAYNGSSAWRLSTSTNQGFSIDSIQPSTQQRVYVSASGFVGIGTTVPDSNLHVFKGTSGTPGLGLPAGTTLTLENNTTNYINFKTPNAVVAGLAFSTPADSSAGYISLRQSTGEMFYSTENGNGYHTFFTADTERLRVANTETTVRNNLIVSGASSQFTASGTSLFNNEVDIFGTSSSLNISGSTVGGVTINVSSSLQTQPALLISQAGTGSALTVNGYVNLGHPTDFNTGGRLNVLGSTYLQGNVFMTGTTNFIQNTVAARANIYFGSNGNSWLNNGNFGLGTSSPTRRLDVVGSSSFSGDVTISNLLTLTPQHPLPTSNLTAGAFAVSSSTPPKPYFYDGFDWKALY